MKKESNVRRNAIVDAIAAIGVIATVYRVTQPGRQELRAREACLRALITDITAAGHQLLVLEQDDSLLRWDRQRLIEITDHTGCRGTLRYEHFRAEHELLLAVPDAIAWCWARDGLWRNRVQQVVTQVRVLL